MASSNIKLFDENKGNMLTDTEFNVSTQRLNGLQTGVASSQLQNKAMYQASLVAYAIAQVMMQNGKNANDTDAVSAFVANLSGAMLQKVYDLASTEEAQAGVATGKWMSPALVKAAIDALAAKAQNVLSDNTKALFGLGTDAVPDDVFNLLSNLIPSDKGLLTVRMTDGDGNPAQSTLSVSPSINGSASIQTNADGFFRAAVSPGTYTISAGQSSDFESYEPSSQTVTIQVGRASSASFVVRKITSGLLRIDTSCKISIPAWVNSVDIFACGAGGSGAVGITQGGSNSGFGLGGGGGGYTKYVKNDKTAIGKTLTITIGSGGAGVSTSTKDTSKYGNPGGATKVVGGGVSLSASGGSAGSSNIQNGVHSGLGGRGGSGGGGTTQYNSGAGNGGSDGRDGDNNGGAGQGTTTRAFGESSGELFGGGGGAANIYYSGSGDIKRQVGSGGSGGGSSGKVTIDSDCVGLSPSNGGGSGAAIVNTMSASSVTSTSASGANGVVLIRW